MDDKGNGGTLAGVTAGIGAGVAGNIHGFGFEEAGSPTIKGDIGCAGRGDGVNLKAGKRDRAEDAVGKDIGGRALKENSGSVECNLRDSVVRVWK